MSTALLPSFSDEQAMLVEASSRFMEDRLPIAEIRRRCEPGATVSVDHEAYRSAAAELGWFGLLASEAAGGGSVSGNGVLDAAVIACERGARLQSGPFVGHSVVVDSLTRAGSHPSLLEELVLGAAWATWSLDAHRTCSLREEGGEWRLDGTIQTVADGAICEWLLLSAQAPAGLTGVPEGATDVVVALDSPGVTIRPLDGLDISRTWCAIDFDGVVVAPTQVVAGPDSERGAARQAHLAAVLCAAETVGAMSTDLDQAVRYAMDRIAFGRPIGSFQAIKHLLADTSLWLEMSKGLVVDAATAMGTDAPDGPELAHAAKAFVAERGIELAHNCFQVFGGIGYTWEHDQHLFLRRIAADAQCFGSATWHRDRLLEEAGVGR